MPHSPEGVASAPGPAAETVLTDEMLARFAKRAPQYDRDNAFFVDDFEELRQAGYLRVAVPAELGGAGLPLALTISCWASSRGRSWDLATSITASPTARWI